MRVLLTLILTFLLTNASFADENLISAEGGPMPSLQGVVNVETVKSKINGLVPVLIEPISAEIVKSRINERMQAFSNQILDLNNLSNNRLGIPTKDLEEIVRHTNLAETKGAGFIKALKTYKSQNPDRELKTIDRFIPLMYFIVLQMEVADYRASETRNPNLTEESFERALSMTEDYVRDFFEFAVRGLNHSSISITLTILRDKFEYGEMNIKENLSEMRAEVMKYFPEELRQKLADVFASIKEAKGLYRNKDIFAGPNSPSKVLNRAFNSYHKRQHDFLNRTSFNLSYLIINPQRPMVCARFFH